MEQLLTALLDLLFPPSQAELLVRNASPESILAEYRPSPFLHTICLCHYHTPLIRAAITQNKFHHDKNAAAHLGALLYAWHKIQPADTVYLPIPLSRQRERARGYNQVTEILKAAQLQSVTYSSVLRRTSHTSAQSTLDRNARLKNVHNAFAVQTRELAALQTKNIDVIDDVATTGATLLAAKQALLPHVPTQTKLTLLALAH